MVFAFFSVYASALGMFDIQQDFLRSDRVRVNVFTQWKEAAKAIAEFKTRALAETNQAKQAMTLDLRMRDSSGAGRPHDEHRASPSPRGQGATPALLDRRPVEARLGAFSDSDRREQAAGAKVVEHHSA
jgi:hypothetical protein